MVTDLRLPSMNGLELIQRAKRLQPALRVVLMSAFGEPKDIVEAMRLGADDFLPKPFDLDVFLALLERLRALAGAPPPDPAEPWIVRSPALRALDEGLAAAADLDTPVLFLGERAVGRSRAARRLHSLRTPKGPFLTLAASELGPAGPEERVLRLLAGGSLLLTGLEGLAPAAAAALPGAMDSPAGRSLRWLATAGRVEELAAPVAVRFAALTFRLPSLRERPEDLAPLFTAMLRAAARREGRLEPKVDRAVEKELGVRAWPGNLRELQACAEASLEACQGPVLRRLPADLSGGPALRLPWPEPGEYEAMLRAAGRAAAPALLERCLRAHAWNLNRAAESLGLTPRILAARLREHGVSLEDRDP
jgi:DNA-binding NtrC family response regulator